MSNILMLKALHRERALVRGNVRQVRALTRAMLRVKARMNLAAWRQAQYWRYHLPEEWYQYADPEDTARLARLLAVMH